MKKKSLMKKIYDSKAFWIVISLLASVSIWLYVTDIDKETQKQTFYGVPVQLEGEDILKDSRNLVITDIDTNTVSIELIGPRRIIAGLSSKDLVAKIDVSKLTQPSYTSQQFYISYPDGTDKSGIEVLRKSPDTVNFMVSNLVKKLVPVRGGFEGDVAQDHLAETPYFEPSTITIYGAESDLKSVEYAWVTFGKDVKAESSYSIDTGFTLMTKEDEPCSVENITFSNDTVKAVLPILDVKDVKLGVDLIEGAGATAANTKITVEPKSVLLAGDSALLSGINRIILDTIDLTDFRSTFSETYMIPLDNDLKNLTGISEAKVTVEIIGLETDTFKVKNISFIHAQDGMDVQILTEAIEVTLRGPLEELIKVRPENIRAVVDLTDFKDSTGVYMPEAKIYVDGFTNVGAVSDNVNDNKVSIEIRKA